MQNQYYRTQQMLSPEILLIMLERKTYELPHSVLINRTLMIHLRYPTKFNPRSSRCVDIYKGWSVPNRCCKAFLTDIQKYIILSVPLISSFTPHRPR